VCVRKSTISFTSNVLDSPSVVDVDSEEDLLLLLQYMCILKQHGKLESCFLVLRGCDLLIKEIMFYSREEEGEYACVYGMCVFWGRMFASGK